MLTAQESRARLEYVSVSNININLTFMTLNNFNKYLNSDVRFSPKAVATVLACCGCVV